MKWILGRLLIRAVNRLLYATLMAAPALVWSILALLVLALYSESLVLSVLHWLADHSNGLLDGLKQGGNLTLEPEQVNDVPFARLVAYLVAVVSGMFYLLGMLARWLLPAGRNITLKEKLLPLLLVCVTLVIALIGSYWWHLPDGIIATMAAKDLPYLAITSVMVCGFTGFMTAVYISVSHFLARLVPADYR